MASITIFACCRAGIYLANHAINIQAECSLFIRDFVLRFPLTPSYNKQISSLFLLTSIPT
ncbi:hypothetical protein C5471_10425 [Photorhabdus tasmaniensis]|uniref:Uncharacterized protein n=1 Tax=Photorhabdus tasmaniensis TaxID=1004159 RepID=A0ABX0GIM9_9GAMM|nr:hypothetical protein [Photorhabdus tasmaniensis]